MSTPAVHRFLSNQHNAIRTAALSATSVTPASGTAKLQAASVKGKGQVALLGSYTGDTDTVIDVEVSSGDVLTEPQAAEPQFRGAGNGRMFDFTAPAGTPLQTYSVRLQDLGITTESASGEIDGVTVAASETGGDGNQIRLIVDEGGLVASETEYSTLQALSAGTTDIVGEQWNFGALPLEGGRTLHRDTPRIRFGNDSQVYRQYKDYRDGEWHYLFLPAIARDVPALTEVKAVTGSRSLTITNGDATETYTGIVSLFDALDAAQNSELLTVTGPVANDRTPGGQATVDLQLRTASYALPTTRPKEGLPLADLSVANDAPTDTVEIQCTNATRVGGESWSVTSAIKGTLGSATTGTPFGADGYLNFLIKRKPGTGQTGDFVLSSTNYASRPETAPAPPPICVKSRVLGASAQPKTLTLTYTKRPGKDCACENTQPKGAINPRLLGLADSEATDVIDPEVKQRLEALYQYRDDYTRNNTVNVLPDTEYQYRVYNYEIAGIAEPERSTTYAAKTQAGIDTEIAANPVGGPNATNLAEVRRGAISAGFVKRLIDDNDAQVRQSLVAFLQDLVYEIGVDSTGFDNWDNLFTEIQADYPSAREEKFRVISADVGNFAPAENVSKAIATGLVDSNTRVIEGLEASDGSDVNENYPARYESRADQYRLDAGIVPGKANGQATGSAAWRDYDSEGFWWTINGGEYLPAFTNRVYHSAKNNDESVPYSTEEFAFAVVVECPGNLVVGDQITLGIGNVDPTAAYSIGDTYTVPIIHASPVFLTGGVTGNDQQSWLVKGSVDGRHPDYLQTADDPTYSETNAPSFRIGRGGIAFALGDEFTVALEGGQWRWREGAGDWSAAAAIDRSNTALVDGLSVAFQRGESPSFVVGDLYRFNVEQPASVNHLRTPNNEQWQWPSGPAAAVADFGINTNIDTVAIALPSFVAGTTVTVEASADDFATVAWSAALPVREQISVIDVRANNEAQQATQLRLTITTPNNEPAALGWWWAGVAAATHTLSPNIKIARNYRMARGDLSAAFISQGYGGEIGWDGFFNQADADLILAISDWSHQHGDEPIGFVPNIGEPEYAVFAVPDNDNLELNDEQNWQGMKMDRRLNATLPLKAVL